MRKITLITAIALLLFVLFLYFGGKDLFDPCKAPIRVTKMNEELLKGKVKKLMSADEATLFMVGLPEGDKDESHYNKEGKEALLIQSGTGTLHSGKMTPKGVKWARDTEVSTGDFIEIEPEVAIQLDNTGKETLLFLSVTTKTGKPGDRQSAPPYNIQDADCK